MIVTDNEAPLLLDASRLVWRRWAGTRATGIDRICLAWMEHYGNIAQAVIVHRHGQSILPFRTSQALFQLLAMPEDGAGGVARFRAAIMSLALRRAGHLRDRLEGYGRFWLNPGHTGLNRPRLAEWVEKRQVRPIHLIHDLIPITHPQFCREGEGKRHRQRMRGALASGAGIIANSQHSLDTLTKFAATEGIPMPPGRVAWPGTPVLPQSQSRTGSVPNFVILGTIEGRKNHALLLQVWRQLIEAEGGEHIPRLLIVGRRGWEADDVFAHLDSGAFGNYVVEAGPLDDRRLAEVLAGARALLFPSFAEGYGMPLAEALAAGVPVIASDLPVFREIGQGVPELISPCDTQSWARAITEYAHPDSLRRQAQIARLERFSAPSWPDHFKNVEKLLAALA